MQNLPIMICNLPQSGDLQVMINCKQVNNFQLKKKESKAPSVWNGTIEFICRRERARRADRDPRCDAVELRFHITEIHTNARLCRSALLCLSGHETADFSLISVLKELMRVSCHGHWSAAYSRRDLFVQPEESMEDLRYALGYSDWLFSADGKSHIKSRRRPDTILCSAYVLVSARFRTDATKSMSLWQRPPFPAARGLSLLV